MRYQTVIKVAIFVALVPVGLAGLVIASIALNLPLPASPDWLYKYQSDTQKGDRLVGGGYFFMADGRDLWIRFRVRSTASREFSNDCNPQQLATVRTWFLDNALSPQRLLWVVPLPNDFEADRRILGDRSNLQCSYSGDMRHEYGQVPPDCTHWSLYHPPTQYYYHRYACYN